MPTLMEELLIKLGGYNMNFFDRGKVNDFIDKYNENFSNLIITDYSFTDDVYLYFSLDGKEYKVDYPDIGIEDTLTDNNGKIIEDKFMIDFYSKSIFSKSNTKHYFSLYGYLKQKIKKRICNVATQSSEEKLS